MNGKEVIRVYAGRDYDKDTDKSKPLTLKKGVNVVKVAVTQGDGHRAWWRDFWIRVTSL